MPPKPQTRGISNAEFLAKQRRRIIELKEFKNANLKNTEPTAVKKDFQERQKLQRLQNAIQNQNVSENTKRILENVLRVQNKKFTDNARQQRIHRERELVSDATNLLNTPSIFKEAELDFTGIPENNIFESRQHYERKSL
ncbi:unnamed protein product, partial [marine sediment metagenome]